MITFVLSKYTLNSFAANVQNNSWFEILVVLFVRCRLRDGVVNTHELFQLQMEFSFPFLRANNLRTSLLIMRTRSLSYVSLFLNLISNAVNNNDQHVRSGANVRMSQNPHRRRKRMDTGIIIASRTTITLRPGQGRVARQLHRGSDADADANANANADADADIPRRVLTWLEDLVLHQEDHLRQALAAMYSCWTEVPKWALEYQRIWLEYKLEETEAASSIAMKKLSEKQKIIQHQAKLIKR